MSQIQPMPFETYLAMVNNSIDTRQFSKGYAEVDGKPVDIMRNGELSCAFFVSSLLKVFDVIKSMHATVTSTVKDLETSGWRKVEDLAAGDVIVWDPITFPNGESHEHIGFVIDQQTAVSNNYLSGTPKKHKLQLTPDGTNRKIMAIYRGRHLFESQP